jgi:hypothetical protein
VPLLAGCKADELAPFCQEWLDRFAAEQEGKVM